MRYHIHYTYVDGSTITLHMALPWVACTSVSEGLCAMGYVCWVTKA